MAPTQPLATIHARTPLSVIWDGDYGFLGTPIRVPFSFLSTPRHSAPSSARRWEETATALRAKPLCGNRKAPRSGETNFQASGFTPQGDFSPFSSAVSRDGHSWWDLELGTVPVIPKPHRDAYLPRRRDVAAIYLTYLDLAANRCRLSLQSGCRSLLRMGRRPVIRQTLSAFGSGPQHSTWPKGRWTPSQGLL
jgi:hypothetical protein